MRAILATLSDSLVNTAGKIINKVLALGRDDVKTAYQLITPGVEGRPIDGSKVILLETMNNKDRVVIGTIEESQEIEKGEVIIYSRDEDGAIQNTILLRQNGDIEIGGKTDNMVRFLPLSNGLAQSDIDINVELAKIAVGIAAGGGSYSPTPISTDISGAKIDEVKTSS